MKRFWGYLSVILATVFFGISATFDKIMLQDMHPLLIASLTYTIAGVFLFSIRLSPLKESILDIINKKSEAETFISPKDYLILFMTAIASSVIAPLLYLEGLNQTTAVTASLLLNVEVLFIISMSLMIFHEPFKKKDILGIFFLTAGALFLATGGEFLGILFNQSFVGSLLIILASFFWAIDTVFSKFLSHKRDLIWIAALKSSIGGIILFLITLVTSINLQIPLSMLPFLIFVGIFSIGTAFLLIYIAIREIGSARVGSIFPLAALFGAIFAFIILGEEFNIMQLSFGLLMLLGVLILYWEPENK